MAGSLRRTDSLLRPGEMAAEIGIPLSDVRGVEVQGFSPGRTLGLVVLVTGVAALIGVAAYTCIELCGDS